MRAIINTIVYANLLPFLLLAILLVLTGKNPLFNKRQSELFRIAICGNMALLVAISLDAVFDKMLNDNIYLFRRVTSFMSFAATPLVPLLLYKIFSPKKSRLLLYLPAVLNFCLCAISIGVRIVFEITPNNTYARGPLFFVPFLIGLFYLGILIVSSTGSSRERKRDERALLMITGMGLALFMYMEIAFRFRFMVWNWTALSIVAYYLLLNINNATKDPLTGANNRALYAKRLSEYEGQQPLCIAVIDINNFKMVNDTMGHNMGDQYLIRLTEALQSGVDRHSALFRIGGDEFVILSKRWTAEELARALDGVRKTCNAQNLDFAYGIASYSPNEPIERAIQAADHRMYLDKANAKPVPMTQ